ncbi:uncharacterized protein BT62DRAFT_936914 [Guyanagaster necrorhizus]|uniref:SH3 domain-containing protein n=1 Tax=Guyanagaster necrorhizus TaxID=856835 RepID=A0A9P7VJR7_9AGAR|nr:uncharacterized protein BT62DRAFT_936914 [Guyanagaster necrorhizus MCA 3950]KAG7441600.1 hypothetical protein BT62DRAFT_936914 [Guyanagaster necrorhizus MCA 3950]
MDEEEQHSVLEDDSDGEEHFEDDVSSDLSIPNEAIDFDLVYAFHSFAATVDGQANVVKGDSLFLMDDSNSYWWLVRVLKTQEVGYIPAENIETPFERLARLNKHRNVDLAQATPDEELGMAPQDRINVEYQQGSNQSHSPILNTTPSRSHTRGVSFRAGYYVHRYLPALWHEEEEEEDDIEWDDIPYEGEDPDLAEEEHMRMMEEHAARGIRIPMEPDDGMQWEDSAAEEMRSRQQAARDADAQATGPSGAISTSQRPGNSQQQPSQVQPLQIQQEQLTRTLRSPSSQERLLQNSPTGLRNIDPAEVIETRKLTATPSIARDSDEALKHTGGTVSSSVSIQQRQQEEERKRLRDEEDEAARKRQRGKEKMAPPVSSAGVSQGKPSPGPTSGSGKLRKERTESDDDGKDKKKKGGMFSIFGRKKDKNGGSKEKNNLSGSVEGDGRTSEDSSRSGHRPSDLVATPAPSSPMQQQQQQQALQQQQVQQQQAQVARDAAEAKRQQPEQQSAAMSSPPQVSQLRQRDQQQQALYLQYLNRSPASPPEAQPSYGLQSASAVLPPSSYHSPSGSAGSATGLTPPTTRQRPGSLILTASSMDGQGVPDLSVIRVFTGKNLQTDATFKTVLLNSSTTSADLVKQAMQRFRLPSAENAQDYYLVVKQIEGSSARLQDQEKPLGVFETLVEAAMEMPKVKRSSVGSISSITSNLSMHPAIKKLAMNDFTDDSAVKFYLNRAGDEDDSLENEETLLATDLSGDSEIVSSPKQQYLTVSTAATTVPTERFSSPSYRFALQLVIYPDDLPDDMVFDPQTEAIVFKETLNHRPQSGSVASPGITQHLRRKVFVFPKNVTVAEVIELGLERFGILEGVVDGGDEVEDKSTKRRSISRVRYGLAVDAGNHERELSPSSRIIDAYPRPPNYRAVDRRYPDNKRRSIDSAQLLGSTDDVGEDDPVFILRRAISYRASSSRHRMSAPLDEIALRNLHRESVSSTGSEVPAAGASSETAMPLQPSRQEIIEAQRQAKRANQMAIVSAQTNSVRGLDLLLPGNAMLRSSRYDANDRMRYSYVEPDGETYDISDLVEEELKGSDRAHQNDLLEGVLDNRGNKLDRVLNKIKSGKSGHRRQLSSGNSRTPSLRSTSPSSQYSLDDNTIEGIATHSRSTTPASAGLVSRTPIPPVNPYGRASPEVRSRAGTTTPTVKPTSAASRRQPSIGSVMSDLSGYVTAPTPPAIYSKSSTDSTDSGGTAQKTHPTRRPFLPKDDFGVSKMLAVIEYRASKSAAAPLPKLDPVDEMLFGRPLDATGLHPKIREIYASSFEKLAEMDKILDDLISQHP